MKRLTVNSLSTLYVGDCREVLRSLPEQSVHCVMTSPPYFALRSYLPDGHPDKESEIGSEPTPDEFVAAMVEVFGEVWRVLRDDGNCWVNLGDSYCSTDKWGGGKSGNTGKHTTNGDDVPSWAVRAKKQHYDGLKPKDLIGVPWRVAFALQAAGWYLRDAVIWAKPSPMPGSQRDRCTSSYEFVFQLTKRARYFFDMEAVKEESIHAGREVIVTDKGFAGQANGKGLVGTGNAIAGKAVTVAPTRIPRNVWRITNTGYAEAHFATYPLELCRIPILSSTSEKGCCSECGTPWGRVVEKSRKPTRPGRNNCSDETGRANRDEQRHVTESKTTGWEPGCDCNADIVPCTVLDPFAGSGTTLQFATLHGRRSTGIELNPEYAKLAVKRINTPLEKPERIESLPGQMTLFEETA